MILEFVTLSLFLSLPIYTYLQEVFISHQDWRFCLRHMWQEEPQRSWDTDGQIGSCEGMEPGGTMRPRGLQRWCPSLALHPRGPSPRASLPAAGPRLLPAPAAPPRPCFSPCPVAFADSSYSPLWRSATCGGKRGFRDTWSTVRGVGSKSRNAPPSGERGENWGSASDEERTSDDAGRGWGRRAGACHGSRRRDGPQGCFQGEGWAPGMLRPPLGALLLPLSTFHHSWGFGAGFQDCDSWGQAFQGWKVGSLGPFPLMQTGKLWVCDPLFLWKILEKLGRPHTF